MTNNTEILARLTALEKKNRRLQFLLFLAIGIFSIAGIYSFQSSKSVPKVIEAEKFVLKDGNKEVGSWYVSHEKNPEGEEFSLPVFQSGELMIRSSYIKCSGIVCSNIDFYKGFDLEIHPNIFFIRENGKIIYRVP